MKNFNKFDVIQLETQPLRLISDTWMLITAGAENSFNSMTASWGGLGYLWQRPVAFVFIRPQRYTLEFVEREPVLTLSFLDRKYRNALNIMGTKSGRNTDKVKESGLTPVATPSGSVAFSESRYIFECKKLYAENLKPEKFIETSIVPNIYPLNDFHKMFIVEITQGWKSDKS
ncbi:MAG: flavin reductase [Prevotellaceae bacterium]|jgi:flavin reductase (DIM6/NTAB) family NADH-FMN oxidoreductase RutF|nr:flavin reductase [Prevotellaceae bacterium]